ncbi:MAG: DUF4337 domain-containing protein [Candidatus Zixiibacteriota bacterium]
MADEKKEPWLNYLALTTVILAVCATLSTFKGGGYSTRSVINQSMAANQWSYYQAKSIKGYLYELEKQNLELDIKSHAESAAELVDDYKKALAEAEAKISKYAAEKDTIQADAKKFEEVRDHAQRHSQVFGMAVIFLQIAILLSSIAALLKKKLVWVLGLAVGVIGMGYFLYAISPLLN